MNAKELTTEYLNLYSKYVGLKDDNDKLSQRVDVLTNDMGELEFQWEQLCKKNGIKIIKK